VAIDYETKRWPDGALLKFVERRVKTRRQGNRLI
jgi:hypothetical protein